MKWSVFTIALVALFNLYPDFISAQAPFIRFHHLNISDGLSGNRVRSIYQDKYGFIWFATEEGLDRFDGKHFIVYRHRAEDVHSLPNNIVTWITGDHAGNLWLATASGISCLHPFSGKFDDYYVSLNKESRLVAFNKVACLPSGEVIGMINPPNDLYPELFRVDVVTHRLFPLSLPSASQKSILKNKTAHSLALLNNGWIIYQSGFELFISKDGARHFDLLYKGRPGPYEKCFRGSFIFYADSNTCWLSNRLPDGKSHLMEYNIHLHQWRLFTTPAKIMLSEGKVYGDHDYWFGGYTSGLLRINNRSGKIERYFHNDDDASSLSDNTINSCYVDRQATFWIATEGGVDYWNSGEDHIHYLNSETSGFEKFGNLSWGSMAEDKSGNLWLGTVDYSSTHNALFLLNPLTLQFREFNCPHFIAGGNLPVWNILPMQIGKILLSTQAGVYEFSPQNKKFSKTISLRLPRIVRQFPTGFPIMKKDHKGNIWFGLWKKGLIRYNPVSHSTIYLNTRSASPLYHLSDDQVSDAVEDQSHLLWVIYRDNTMLTCISTITGEAIRDYILKYKGRKFINGFNCICADSSGKIWIGTMGEGLVCFDPSNGKVAVYNYSNGLTSDIIYSLCTDREGRLWIYTAKGIQCMETISDMFYTIDLDIPPPPGSIEGSPMIFSKNNRLFVGYGKNLVYFNPDKVLPSYHTRPPIPLSVQRMDKIVSLPPDIDSIVVHHQDAYIRILFASLDMLHGDKLQYGYRLAGFNNYWISTGNEGRATFSHLSPGSYTLEMRTIIPGIPWSGKYSSLTLVVIPLFYQTWWFRFILVLLLSVIIIYIIWRFSTKKYRLQLAVMEREKQITDVRNHIARDIHDDIGAGLTRIAVQCEILKHMPGQKVADHAATMDHISKQARELIQSLGEIVWTINPANDHVDNMLSFFAGYIHHFFENSGLTYSIHFPEGGDNRTLHPDIKRNLLLILKESLNNIVRHAEAKEVSISFAIHENGDYEMIMEDDGKGFQRAEFCYSGGNGLHNLKLRAEDIHARISFVSTPGEGLKICVLGSLY